MSALLEVQGLETAYGSSQVLFGIDLQVESGQVATLLGRNGMGKTTTVRSVLGLTRSKGGTVRFRGERIDQLGADKIARMGLAVVPEGRQIFPNLSVEENLRAFATPYIQPEANDPKVVVLDNRLDGIFGHLPGWAGDRHPNLAGYNVIADETAKWLAPVIRQRK